MRLLRTPLRYPGGKSRVLNTLSNWFPKNITEYREPFIGGGSMAIHTAKTNPDVSIWINDLYFPVYNFWLQLRDNGKEVSDRVREEKLRILSLSTQEQRDEEYKKLYEKCCDDVRTGSDNLQKAVSFYIINRCGFSGLHFVFSSISANTNNFSLEHIDKLPMFSKLISKWKITNLDYSEVMNAPGKDGAFVFLDPPYDIDSTNLYGDDGSMHEYFDHVLFAKTVYQCPHDFMITYNVNERLKELYKDYVLNEWEIQYCMMHREDNLKKELLVTNYPVNCKGNSFDLLWS